MARSENNARKEWGLPDWRDPSSYGDTKKWSLDRWRWEFTRRRCDYRSEFDATAPAIYRGRIEAVRAGHIRAVRKGRPSVAPTAIKIDEPGFAAGPGTKYGLFGDMPNPRISDQPPHAISFSPDNFAIEIIQGANFDASLGGDETEFAAVPAGTMAVVLDLTKPWSPALGDQIKRHFLSSQERRFGKVAKQRKHSDIWLRYLRVLDGRECGASLGKLADIAKPSANSYPTKSGVIDVFDAANKLMVDWPAD